MDSERIESVMRRKAQSGLQVRQARTMSVPKALRITLAKVADELFDMAMSVIGATSETLDSEACVGSIDPAAALILLDGPARATGAAILDGALVGALIQQQTMGTVTQLAPGAEPRKMTETDTAMCAPFLDALLARSATLPEIEAERALLEGFRFGARAEDVRLLQMALEEPEYQVFRLTIDVAGGRRQGKLDLFLPHPEMLPVSSQIRANGDAAGSNQPTAVPRFLADAVMSLKAELTVAVARTRLPLSRVTALKAGDTLDLGITSLDGAMVLGADGKQVSSGLLGQSAGHRALRVDRPRRPATVPQRRTSDRASLDLPSLAPIFDVANREPLTGPDAAAFTLDEGDADAPDLPGLPEFSDLPDISDQPDFAGLPDLPDMSDLPELSGLAGGAELTDNTERKTKAG